MIDKVTPIRKDVSASVTEALQEALDRAQASPLSGVMIVAVDAGSMHLWHNEELRAESVIALCECVKKIAVESLISEIAG